MDRRLWYRILLALATLPVAVLTNGFRVAGTGAAAQYYGPDAAQGFFHAFSGWLAFLAAFALLFALDRALKLLLHTRAAPARQ
jgi:exosortase/archaeosortase family protein